MAELIDKEVLDNEHIYVIETDGNIHKMIFCGDCDWEERPVTTLAEIRAKAIDEFAEKLKTEYIHYDIDDALEHSIYTSYSENILALEEYVDKLAEQLKEEQ